MVIGSPCVEFNAWTYYRGGNIWASLMYRIFNDLNDQLEIEELLGVSTEGGVSSIEVSEQLSRGERDYLRERLSERGKEDNDIDKIMRDVRDGLASKSFASVSKWYMCRFLALFGNCVCCERKCSSASLSGILQTALANSSNVMFLLHINVFPDC